MAFSIKLFRNGLHWKKVVQLIVISTFVILTLKILASFMYTEAVSTKCVFENVFSITKLPFCYKDGDIDMVDKGKWVPLEGLTEKDYITRFELDKFIRISMDWAPILHRRDLRCGHDAPIPGYRLLAQCDPLGMYPCCNLNTGLCGNGKINCDCENCTNFQTMVSAELAAWQPKQCKLKDFSLEDTCKLLQENKIRLYFMGDSLIRQLHSTMLLHLTNDYEEGAIPQNVTEKVRQQCSGVLQLTKKECSIDNLAQSVDELKKDSVCPGFTPNKFTVDQIQDYHTTLIPKVKDKISSLINQENAWIIGGVGLHYQLDFELLKKEYLEKILALLKGSHNQWPKILWVETHAYSGYIRQKSGPRMKVIKKFNQVLGDYLKKNNIPVIRTFEITKSVRSYDGRHHGMAMNQLKLKLIFNYLSQYYYERNSLS